MSDVPQAKNARRELTEEEAAAAEQLGQLAHENSEHWLQLFLFWQALEGLMQDGEFRTDALREFIKQLNQMGN
jgi:hypothetical protein